MKKIMLCIIFIGLFFATTLTFSNEEILLNKISFPMSAKAWIITQSAMVTVTVNATLQSNQIEQMRNEITTRLSSLIPNVQWHITQFNHAEDQTGLAKLSVQLQARVQNSELSNLDQKIKKLSEPGKTFNVEGMDFSPTLEEQQEMAIKLRSQIYQKAKQEVLRLNQAFPGSNYFVHAIQFEESPRYYTATVLAREPSSQQPSVPFGREAQLQATVVLSSLVNSHHSGGQSRE